MPDSDTDRQWAGYGDDYNDDDQVTSAVMEDVPLTGEDGAAPVFPESAHDDGHLTGLRQRQHVQDDKQHAKDVRTAHRRERYTALLDRFVVFVEDHHLLPASWLERTTESGERFPRVVCVVRNNFKRWWWTVMTTVSFVASVLWIVQFALGAPSVVMHDGTSVVNLYAPATIYTVDLASDSVATWLDAHRSEAPPIRGSDLSVGYFSADVYHVSEKRNVTLDWLGRALHDACNHDATDAVDRCTCMPAVEIGVLANAIFVDGILMIKPRITKTSDLHIPAAYGDGTTASQPIVAVVEYMHRDGVIERRKEKLNKIACIARSIDLVDTLKK